MSFGILALAAGRSRRFGSDKRLAILPDGQLVLDTFLAQVDRSGLPLLMCLRENDNALASTLDDRNVDYQLCHRAAEGMGGTLAEGVAQISHWDGVLIALADMPWVQPSTYIAIAEGLSPGSICVPIYESRRGHPVGFGRWFYPQLMQLGGDTGARQLITKYAQRVVELEVKDPAIHSDIDLPTDVGDVLNHH